MTVIHLNILVGKALALKILPEAYTMVKVALVVTEGPDRLHRSWYSHEKLVFDSSLEHKIQFFLMLRAYYCDYTRCKVVSTRATMPKCVAIQATCFRESRCETQQLGQWRRRVRRENSQTSNIK